MKIIEITSENFESEVLRSEIPVIVDFWAEWCGPCRMMAPVVDSLAEKYDGKIKVCKLNVDSEPEICGDYKIMSIPTVIRFTSGLADCVSVGLRSEEELISALSLEEFIK
ncbi:MAG: thioredoxin [Clostridia bacterium]|nr:thioredoxin [Clostridia bacterium]